MISMHYRCRCGYATGILDAAQHHADLTGHDVGIIGTITTRAQIFQKITIEEKAERTAREGAILREAKKRRLG